MGFWRDDVIQPALNAELETSVREQQELLKNDPLNPRTHFALGTLAHLRGHSESAVQFFLKAIELDPAYAAPHASLGRIYAIQGENEQAWEHAREASRLGDSSLLRQLERYPNASQP